MTEPTIVLLGAPSFYRPARFTVSNARELAPSSRSGKMLMGDQDHEPSHGIFYLKSAIERRFEAKVKCVDLNIEHYKSAVNGIALDDFSMIEDIVSEFDPVAIGISSMRPNYSEALRIARWLKKSGSRCVVFLGGPCTSDVLLPNKSVFDFLIKEQKEERAVDSIAENLALLPRIESKPEIYFPDYSDLSEFTDLIPRYFQSMGCGAGCDFCYPASVRNFKLTTANGRPLSEKIAESNNFFKPKFWLLGDLTFYLQSRQSKELLRSLAQHNSTPWWCQTQARYLDETSCAHLRDAGCAQVAFAIEDFFSQDPRLRAKNRGIEQTLDCLKMLGDQNIDRQVYWCFGLPDDCHAASEARISDIEYLVSRNLIDSIHLSYLMPYPGTAYGDNPEKYGIYIHKTLDEHYAEVIDDFYDPIPLHSTNNLNSKEIKGYFDTARKVAKDLNFAL